MNSLFPLECPDAQALAALESAAAPHAWSAGQYRDSIAAGHRFWGLGSPEALRGFAVVMPVLDEAELLNIVIDAPHQGQGLGRQLLEAVLAQLAQEGCQKLMLEVRESNLPARRLYQRCGFAESGLRKNYYPAADGREHAVLMERQP